MPLSTGVTNAYHFDEASGNALDALLSADLTAAASPGTTTGKLSGARTLVAASSQYFYVAKSVPTEFSLFIGIKLTSLPSSSNMNVCSWSNAIGGGNLVSPTLHINTSGKACCFVYDGAGKTVTGTTTLSTGVWYRLGMTYKDGGSMTLYVNGASEGTPLSVGTPFSGFGAGPYFQVGLMNDNNPTPFDGAVDECVLWSREITGSEATQDYNSGNWSAYPFSTDYTLTSAQGSFTLSGQVASLKAGRLASAVQGSYTLAGQSASLTSARIVTAAQGSCTLTGQSAALLLSRVISAAQGSLSLSGQAAVLTAARQIVAGQGTVTLTGRNATLTYSGGTVVVPLAITQADAFRMRAQRKRMVAG